MLAIFPEISAAVQAGQIEQVAILARRYFCGDRSKAPKVDVHALIRSAGIPVTKLRIQEHGVIAVSDERGSVRCSIAIKADLDAVDEAFLLSHLFGHYLLHIQPRIARAEWAASGYRDETSPLEHYVHATSNKNYSAQQQAVEDAADRFAASLLLPAAMLLKACEALQDKEKVARLFGVSDHMIERRLEDIASLKNTPVKIEVRPAASRGPITLDRSTEIADASASQVKEDTAHMVREKHHNAAPTPRAVAKQSYSSQQPESPKKEVIPTKGMERLREIARQLDKTGR